MVFNLVSNVHSRNSIAEIKMETKLYQMKQQEIDVGNPFGMDVIYRIEILIEKPPSQNAGKKSQQAGRAPEKKKGKEEKQKFPASYVPDAFFCKQETVKVRKGGSA
jgi:hypothetical protein